MGIRHNHHIDLTIACALIDRHLSGTASYIETTALVQQVREVVQAELLKFPELQADLLEQRISVY